MIVVSCEAEVDSVPGEATSSAHGVMDSYLQVPDRVLRVHSYYSLLAMIYCESVRKKFHSRYHYVGSSIPLCTCNYHEDRCESREEPIHKAYSASTSSIR